MYASLPMYAFAPLRQANVEFWQRIRAGLITRGIDAPDQLSDTVGPIDQLFFTQTCGLPYRAKLLHNCHLLGTADYALPDAPAGYYYSHIIAHCDDPRGSMDDFIGAPWAANSYGSQSGYAAMINDYPALGEYAPLLTGSHANSINAIAHKQAEFGAIDAVSFRFLAAIGQTDRVKVIANTQPTPGLPFIAGQNAPIDALRLALADAVPFAPLGIKSLVDIRQDAYVSVPTPAPSEQVFAQ